MPKQNEQQIRKAIALKLVQYMSDNNLTHAQMAARIECSRQQIAHYRARNTKPTLQIMQNLAKVLNISIDELTGVYSTFEHS